MRVMQINTVVNQGSVGRHAENLGKILVTYGHESLIAYGRGIGQSATPTIKIGNKFDQAIHLLQTRLFDRHGLASRNATVSLIKSIQEFNPDIIHLRNIHGYYLNYPILFDYITAANISVVWTFHDNWPFTGHCSFFDQVNCFRWQLKCYNCPNIKAYPSSYFLDRSEENFVLKKKLFTALKKLTIITPSDWLTNHVKYSFFEDYRSLTIRNGIDIDTFKYTSKENQITKFKTKNKKAVIGIANKWDKRKGLLDFINLNTHLNDPEIIFALVGLSKRQSNGLPENFISIPSTNSTAELASLYSSADVFLNPTYADNFPTTNIEALACGTPVITYNTGGSPEAIDEHTGMVVEKGDIQGLAKAIRQVTEKGKAHYAPLCRARAVKYFNKDDRYMDYLRLYESMLSE